MTVTDRTDATDAEFRSRIAPFESAPTPPEVVEARVVEEVAPIVLNALLNLRTDKGPYSGEAALEVAAAAVAAYRAQDGGAEVARLSPDGELVAIRRGANDWRVSNGGHYRDQHVADWTPLAPQAER